MLLGCSMNINVKRESSPPRESDSCSQIKPVRNKKALLSVQLRQTSRWSQFISGLVAVSTSKSHLHQWPFCYQSRHRGQELQDQKAFVLLQALAWSPSLWCLSRAINPSDRGGMEAVLEFGQAASVRAGIECPCPSPTFRHPFLWGVHALEPLGPLLKKLGLVLPVEQQGTRKRLLIVAFLMEFY